MLILSRKTGQSLIIGDNIEILITDISGDKVKLGINAPREIQVLRKELVQTVQSNREAVMNVTSDVLRQLAANINREAIKPHPEQETQQPEQ